MYIQELGEPMRERVKEERWADRPSELTLSHPLP